MPNPFYFRELPLDGPFCNREKEQRELADHARSLANVVLFSPRRFGKTSLVRRVQHLLEAEGAIPIYAHFFGLMSVDDFAARVARSVFEVTQRHESFFRKALKAIRCFRPVPVLSPDPEAGMKMSVQLAAVTRTGVELLEEVMGSLWEFTEDCGTLVHIVFDEFQEISELSDAARIEGVLRGHIQRHRAAYCFVGSRRRILLAMFNDRRRPFFQSSINYELPPLPESELAEFLAGRASEAGKGCATETALELVRRVRAFPYYAQKLAYFAFDRAGAEISSFDVAHAFETLQKDEERAFEGFLHSLTGTHLSLLSALAKEPTAQLQAHSYVHRHRLVSGSMRKAKNRLIELDLIEQTSAGTWRVVDPVFEAWLQGNLGL